MAAYIQRTQWSSGRGLVLAITIGLHVALIAGLMAWKITEAVVEIPNVSIAVTSLDEQREPASAPAHAKVRLEDIAPVEQVIEVQPVEIDQALMVESVVAETAPSESGAVGGSPDTPLQYRAVRPADDYYPPHAIRLGESGDVILRTCVDAQGRLSAAPEVVRSRTELLDAAAVKWAREALRFTPATRGGVPVASCKDFRVHFTLR